MPQSLQEQYAPQNGCFGCGPANAQGLQIRSFVDGDALVCDWTPEDHHRAFPGMLSGGICGTLLDCHSNWAAAYFLMKHHDRSEIPCTVTAEFTVQLRRPTPMNGTVQLRAWVTEIDGDRARISATLEAGGQVTARCEGLFVAVKEGHPAYHRWA